MAVTSHELIVVAGEGITADLLLWRRYRIQSPGIVERMLDDNPHLAKIHRETPFIPVGTPVLIPIDLDILAGRPQPKNTITIYGLVPGDKDATRRR